MAIKKWADIAQMTIDEAVTASLAMLNRHMAALEVTSKNDYDKYATFTAEEVAAARQREADAKAEADVQPERTAAQAAIGALMDASRDDLIQVAAHIVPRIGIDDLKMMHDALTAMLANASRPQIEEQAQAA